MFRQWKTALLMIAAVGVSEAVISARLPVVAANGSAMPVPSGPSAAAKSPEELAREAYNSGIDHKDKGLKAEADAAKAPKDREKNLKKANDEYGKALKDFKKAIDLVPDAYQAYNGMGFALRKTGDYAKALENYDKALKLNPNYTEALEYRGEAYLGLNRIEDAKQAYLTLFAKDRAQADSLMKAMNEWVARRQAEPAGVDPAVVNSLDSWIKERAKLSSLTANMGLHVQHTNWR
jgi:tetratricopeptide (TPR) repeat protein